MGICFSNSVGKASIKERHKERKEYAQGQSEQSLPSAVSNNSSINGLPVRATAGPGRCSSPQGAQKGNNRVQTKDSTASSAPLPALPYEVHPHSVGGDRSDCGDVNPAQPLKSRSTSTKLSVTGSLSLNSSGKTLSSPNRTSHSQQGQPEHAGGMVAPYPPNNAERAATLQALRQLESTPCAELDILLKAVLKCWDAPTASVTLLGSDQVYMCNAENTEGPTGPQCVAWNVAMCPWTLVTPNPMTLAVDDLQNDARFAGNAHHRGGTQSYLTSPLVASNGHRLGAICIMDKKPRTFSAADCRLMNNFSELAVREIERHANLLQTLRSSQDTTGIQDFSPLVEAYSRCVRNIEDAADACVMLVDTRIEGWKVLYCGLAWKDWTGVDREVCQGRTLNELLEFAHGNPNDVVLAEHKQDAMNNRGFVTSKVRVRMSALPPEVAATSPVRFSFYLSMHPAALDPLDSNTLPIGIPSSVPIHGNQAFASAFYFVRVHSVPDPPQNSRVTNLVNVTRRKSNDHHHRVSRRRQELSLGPLVSAAHLFPGLVARHVLGQGQFGTVYHARWNGTGVALKVTDQEIHSSTDHARAEMEVNSSSKLSHPNIVRILSHVQQVLTLGSSAGNASSSHASAISSQVHNLSPDHDAIVSRLGLRASTGRGVTSEASVDMCTGPDGEIQFLPLCNGTVPERRSSSLPVVPCSPKFPPGASTSRLGQLATQPPPASANVSPPGHQCVVDLMPPSDSGSFVFWKHHDSTDNHAIAHATEFQHSSGIVAEANLNHLVSNIQEQRASILGVGLMETLHEEPASFPSGQQTEAARTSTTSGNEQQQGKPGKTHSSSWFVGPKNIGDFRTRSEPLKPHPMEFEEHGRNAQERRAHSSNPAPDSWNQDSQWLAPFGPLPSYAGPRWHTVHAVPPIPPEIGLADLAPTPPSQEAIPCSPPSTTSLTPSPSPPLPTQCSPTPSRLCTQLPLDHLLPVLQHPPNPPARSPQLQPSTMHVAQPSLQPSSTDSSAQSPHCQAPEGIVLADPTQPPVLSATSPESPQSHPCTVYVAQPLLQSPSTDPSAQPSAQTLQPHQGALLSLPAPAPPSAPCSHVEAQPHTQPSATQPQVMPSTAVRPAMPQEPLPATSLPPDTDTCHPSRCPSPTSHAPSSSPSSSLEDAPMLALQASQAQESPDPAALGVGGGSASEPLPSFAAEVRGVAQEEIELEECMQVGSQDEDRASLGGSPFQGALAFPSFPHQSSPFQTSPVDSSLPSSAIAGQRALHLKNKKLPPPPRQHRVSFGYLPSPRLRSASFVHSECGSEGGVTSSRLRSRSPGSDLTGEFTRCLTGRQPLLSLRSPRVPSIGSSPGESNTILRTAFGSSGDMGNNHNNNNNNARAVSSGNMGSRGDESANSECEAHHSCLPFYQGHMYHNVLSRGGSPRAPTLPLRLHRVSRDGDVGSWENSQYALRRSVSDREARTPGSSKGLFPFFRGGSAGGSKKDLLLLSRRSGDWSESSGRYMPLPRTSDGAVSTHNGRVCSKYPIRLRQWMLLEYCDKGDLASAIDQGWLREERHAASPPSFPVVLACAHDLAHGLAYLHGNCVVHGDLTAENVLLQSDTEQHAARPHGFIAKLSDFGMSQKLGDAQQYVVSETYGSLNHMSPEVIMEKKVGYKADVYSLGVLIWRMLTSARPWGGLSHLQVTIAVGYEKKRLQFPEGTPDTQGLQDLALWCMALNPEDRPTASEVVSELENKMGRQE